jgi:tight adherence protein C
MDDADPILISALTFLAVVALGSAFLVSRADRRRRIEERLRRLDGVEPEAAEAAGPAAKAGEPRSGLLARFARVFAAGKPSEGLKAHLARAGFHDPGAALVYLGSKMLLLALGTVGAAAALMTLEVEPSRQISAALFCGMLLSFVPNLIVQSIWERRRREIRQHLPDAVDLLEITVSAGMGLDMAWNCVADEMRQVSPRLADEMALTSLEMHLGAPRTIAMRHMVDRTGADDLGSLVAVLVQSEKFGTSVSDALRVFAGSMREARSQRAEEAAEKLPVKLLFPLVLLIFPALMIVLVGPAFVRLFDFFGNR